MRWRLSHRADPRALPLADRHYNRQKPGTPQFVKPGRCIVLMTPCERALWVSSAPFAEYVRHAWAGAWECAVFRNEGAGLSSDLITEAIAATLAVWGAPPPLGMITFVDRRHTRSPNPGYCYQRAGWQRCGASKGGLDALQIAPGNMPDPMPPIGHQADLLAMVAAE